jgi:DNA-binding NarL/FixJ family response regulator
MVVDDHILFRRGLISLLSDFPEFLVVGEAGNGQEALHIIVEVQPDIILMDVNMPVVDGISAVQTLRGMKHKARIIMLTISQHEADLMGAIAAGADGYILKNSEPEHLRKSIILTYEGKSVLSPEVTAPVLKALVRTQTGSGSDVLSDRELEVLQCLARGQTTMKISSQLFISENTVKTHIRHILEKLDASNRTEAVSKAIQQGLIQRMG